VTGVPVGPSTWSNLSKISTDDPKSAILQQLSDIRILSGFKSLCKIPH